MLKFLYELLRFDRPAHVVDIGANPIDGDPSYKPLVKEGLCRVTGFEPQAEALAALNRNKTAHETYLPYAVGDGSTKTLNICRYSGWTSTLKPSAASLEIFPVFAENATVMRQEPLQTHKLDDIKELDRIDFLKIDIQGGELDAFRNATRHLANVAIIETEVSFVTLYDGQPGLGEIDVELRRQGFMPHCFSEVKRCPIAPLVLNNNPRQALNQVLEADMVYVKDFREPGSLDDMQVKTMCFIATVCYGSFDLAFRCMLILQQRGAVAADAAQRYMQLVSTMARPR